MNKFTGFTIYKHFFMGGTKPTWEVLDHNKEIVFSSKKQYECIGGIKYFGYRYEIGAYEMTRAEFVRKYDEETFIKRIKDKTIRKVNNE